MSLRSPHWLSATLTNLLLGEPYTQAVACQLESLALADVARAHAFGLTPETVEGAMRSRLDLLQRAYPDFARLQAQLGIPINLLPTLWDLWLPLAMQIAQWRQQQGTPLVQGILGGQGMGKTTLGAVLSLLLGHLGYATVSLSLDDLYLTYAERQELQQQDPRLDRRGPPGTHDIKLGLQVLDQLRHAQWEERIAIPRFDKSLHQGAGDRTEPEWVEAPAIILFEGWFVGVRPINPAGFDQAPPPIVTLDDQSFARDMNTRLREYLPLWQRIDRLMVLQPVDYRLSLQWRKEAEHKMIAQGKAGMSDGAIEAFVEYFWKALHPDLFLPPLLQDSTRVDLVIEIEADHQPGRVWRSE